MISYQREEGLRLLSTVAELKTMMAEKSVDDERRQNMFLEHWKEVADEKDLMVFDPDYARYRQLIEANRLVVVTARLDNNLIGYVFYMLAPHLHYKTRLMALEDIHYVTPEHRHQGAGKEMLTKGEEVLKAMGVCYVFLRTKVKHDHGELFAQIGYTQVETVWGKRLG